MFEVLVISILGAGLAASKNKRSAAANELGDRARASEDAARPQKPSKPLPSSTEPVPSPPPPGRESAPGGRSAKQAALDMLTYANTPGRNWGTASNPSPQIKAAQRDMGGGLVPDGIWGPKLRARGKQLGVNLPARDSTAPKSRHEVVLERAIIEPPPAPSAPYQGHPLDRGVIGPPVSKPKPRPAAAPASKPKPKSKPPASRPKPPTRPQPAAATAPAPSATRTAKQAAEDMLTYARTPGRNWGTASKRSPQIAAAQQDMGLPPDGIWGPKLRARAKELGVNLPPRS